MPATTVSADAVLRWMEKAAALYDQHKGELTQFDAAIGDADHGANMTRGFSAVRGKLDSLKGSDIGVVFKTIAMTLISTVGGASGPLYGTLFLQAAAGANGKMELTEREFAAALDAGLQGLINRGKAELGDKTMIDALTPAIAALKEGETATAFTRALDAARKGSDATIPLVARKGRASYLGERSAGHRDPGAASTALLFEALEAAVSA